MKKSKYREDNLASSWLTKLLIFLSLVSFIEYLSASFAVKAFLSEFNRLLNKFIL